MKKSSFACTLAAQIRNADKSFTQSEAMTIAWMIVNKGQQPYSMLTFMKKDGSVCRRVVSENWQQYDPPKGTGRKMPEGLRLFADLGKFIGNQRCIISTYNIISLESLAA